MIFGVLCIVCIHTPKSEADFDCQFVTLRTRTHVTVWLVDCVLVIASHCFSSVGHCFWRSSLVYKSAVVFPVLGNI